MSLFRRRALNNDSSDAGLVVASLGGDRDAFAVIVTRYQSLLCSLAYSAVGDLKHSEDVAQETFIEAWKKLDTLRDPEKLKAWLCGILRFKASHFRRKEARQPVKNTEEIDELHAGEVEDHGSDVSQVGLESKAIREQEEQLLWDTLEKLPENYRAPLILFYREQCSVELVAEKLELSESTAKQRLSRGRKLLQEAMVTFVEDTLTKSKPGTVFTVAVLASIINIAPPVKAATLGVGVLKVGSVFKWSSLFVVLASFSGVIGSFFSVRASLDLSRTINERRRVISTVILFFAFAFIFVAGMYILLYLAVNLEEYRGYFLIASQLLVLGITISYLILTARVLFENPKLRAQERELHPEAFLHPADAPGSKQREYLSRYKFLGVPLVHFKLGMPEVGDKPAFAWIAGGDRAYGLLFAWGGFAVAPISVGILSVGVFSVGAIGLGVVGIGTIALGYIGFGASAIAYKAYSSLSSLGWESAISGCFAIAREAAIGPVAFAKQVNNELAAEIANLNALNSSYLWVLGIMAFLVIVPAVWHANKVRQQVNKN